MRISDGSSDVCSSDLDQPAPADPGRGDRGPGAGDPPGDLDGDPRREGQGPGDPHRRQEPKGPSPARRRLRHPGERGVGVDRPRGRLGGRSEEHTSELQSLMRISYAVFCLKKKQYENKTNIYY